MSRAKKIKEITSKITSQDEKQVVELSLNNLDFGARRLASLIKEKKIFVSDSEVYRILKRNDLQTREKRLAKINESISESQPSYKKSPIQIAEKVAERIVQIALQNPGNGASRLMSLLDAEDIKVSPSTIYAVLKVNGIQTKEKRLAKIQAQRSEKQLPQKDVEIPVRQTVEDLSTQSLLTKPDPFEPSIPTSKIIEERKSSLRMLQESKTPKQIETKSPWFLMLINFVLLLLSIFLGYSTWQSFHIAKLEPEVITANTPITNNVVFKPEIATMPLSHYQTVWNRNLFNTSEEIIPAPKKEIKIENISLAKKDLGLTLVGTIVAEDPKFSRAFIETRNEQKQLYYREGEMVNKILIEKVLRNQIIIFTEEGEKRLVVENNEFTKRSKTQPNKQLLPGGTGAPSNKTNKTLPPNGKPRINF